MFRIPLALAALALIAGPTFAAEPPKKILLVGTGPDTHKPTTHEYMAGLNILAQCLKSVPGIEVTVVKADGPWKEGPDLIGRSDTVVLFMTEGAKWVTADEGRLAAFRKHAAGGGGLVGIHWGMASTDPKPIEAFVELFGGCHGGPDRKLKVGEFAVTAAEPRHPATAGVKDYTAREEFYYKLKQPKAGGVTPVLHALIDGQKETVAWAWERPGGGRSFGYTGMHYHDCWKQEDARRFVAQGVLWATKLPVPAAGLKVDLPESAYQLK